MSEALTGSDNWVSRLPAAKLRAAAERIKERRRASGGALGTAPPPRPDGPLPLSFAQERLWFLDQLVPGSWVYNMPLALQFSGRLEPAALAAALAAIVARHEVLRTSFPSLDGKPAQRIAPASEALPMPPLVDLAALPAARVRTEGLRLVAAEAARPFDLAAAGPPLRATLVRLRADLSQPRGERWLVLLTLHHISADGWSLGILVRELCALYAAAVEGRVADLPPLAWQYADFAVWQRAWLTGEVLERQLAFWRERLAGAPPVIELPLDRPRPTAQSHRGSQIACDLPTALAVRLGEIARRHGATLFMVLLAGFAALLARLCGQDDLVLGTPVAGRNRLEVEGLIGFFVNTLALRLDLAGDLGLDGLLAHVRESTLGAYAHQDLPFEKLVSELHPERSLAHAPLLQVMFSLQNLPENRLELPGLTVEEVRTESGESAKFDLSLSIAEKPSQILGALEYSAELFDEATARRLAALFVILMEGMAAAPAQPFAELPLLAGAERRQLVAPIAGVAGGRHGEAGPCLHHLVAARAAAAPAAPAIVTPHGPAVSYGELDAHAALLAGRLRELGVRRGVSVGVCLPRSPELVVSLLATLAAGGVYLPLDPSHPPERLAWTLADAGATVVVTAGDLLPQPPPGVRRLDLAAWRSSAPAAPGSAGEAAAAVRPEDLAYVIYTSGSTGHPKGVAVPHGDAAAHFQATAAFWGLGPGDRVPLLASPGFDVSLDEILPAILAGAALAIGDEAMWEPAGLLERVAALGLTAINLPTAYWSQWAAEIEDKTLPEGLALRLVLVGGEAMPADAARRWWRGPLAGVRLLNGYGPTETLVTATWCEVDRREAERAAGSVAIGRPFGGRVAHVLDRARQPLPPGVAGELALAGPLARGYLGRPDLTAERFVPDPVAGESEASAPGARLYRTGDLVRRREDGVLVFLGRADGQVKVRGFRIETGEVEAALSSHHAVRQAVVVAREDRPGERRLVAYVVSGPGGVRVESMREHLRARLPAFMVPAAFVVLESLPLTASGKVDRRALPPPEPRGEVGTRHLPPRDPIEEVLAEIWAEVLGVEQVGVEDDFFDLGGHSLLATQVVSRVATVFGVQVPVQRLFASPTVAGLAAAVTAGESAPGHAARTAMALRRLRTMSPEAKAALRRAAGQGG